MPKSTEQAYNKGRNQLGELVGNPGWQFSQLVRLVGCSLKSQQNISLRTTLLNTSSLERFNPLTPTVAIWVQL